MAKLDVVEIDGSTGEGGGQVVRVAIALAALTTKPVRITSIRAGRPKGGGLKAQHIASVDWLAKATKAQVTGLEVGSKTLEFIPVVGPGSLLQRNIEIKAESAASSALLICQAVFPFLLFAGNEACEPIELTIYGGTNVSFSPSYEYLDQVFLPMLEGTYGVHVERRLVQRGWNQGKITQGVIWLKFQPLASGTQLHFNNSLRPSPDDAGAFTIDRVEATILAPSSLHTPLSVALSKMLPAAGLETSLLHVSSPDESHHEARIYVLLVASSKQLRWGRDLLYAAKRKGKSLERISEEVAQFVVRDLKKELRKQEWVDEYLEDQMVIFQALQVGKTCSTTHDAGEEGESEWNCTRLPFELFEAGSLHTRTARWVAGQMLRGEQIVKYGDSGEITVGIGHKSGAG